MASKLVRDGIPEIIAASGRKAVTHVASEEEYLTALTAKLREECGEFIESKNPEELADILEVVYAFADLLGVSRNDIEHIRRKKESERGAFRKKIILEG